MRKGTRRIVSGLAALMLVLTAGGYIASGTTAGTADDPLISLSYLNDVFTPDILKKVDERVSGGGENTGSASAFIPVAVYNGQTILGNEGTEVILRSGRAVSVCPGMNGLSDITEGIDLGNGNEISRNHVYIIARKDGRGITMATDGFIMIKGGYEIK